MELVGPRAVSQFDYCLARARQEAARFTISMDELVNVSGPRPHSGIERRERRREAWSLLRLFCHIAVIGRRRAYAPKKGEPDMLVTWGPLITFLEVADIAGQFALDGRQPPREVTLAAGPWLGRLTAEHPEALPAFGDALRWGVCPIRGTTPGRRQSAGQWRSAHASTPRSKGAAIPVASCSTTGSRATLRRPPGGPQPGSCRRPLGGDGCPAQRLGLIGGDADDYQEVGPAPWKRPPGWPTGKPFHCQGWQEAWLEQKLIIRPGVDGKRLLGEVRAKAAKARKRRRA